MKEKIYTIPVSEVFEPRQGCPVCRLRDALEERYLEYVMGAAMMEPDVRVETNRLGFCREHFNAMLGRKNRLSLALMLESHLGEIGEGRLDFHTLAPGRNGLFSKNRTVAALLTDTCFVCEQIENALQKMLSTIVRQFGKEAEFRKLFSEQEGLCYPHYEALVKTAAGEAGKREFEAFGAAAQALTQKYLDGIKADVSHFCRMFDYRNAGAGADWGNSRGSLERAVWYLTGREVKKD